MIFQIKANIGKVLVCAVLFSAPLNGAEITGRVSGINGEEIYIDLTSVGSPQKGDSVTIFLEIDGEDYEAAKATILRSGKGKVTAATVDGSAAIDMKAVIQTSSIEAAPVKRPQAPVLLCDKLSADPDDADRVSEAVNSSTIDIKAATQACNEALASYPKSARFQYQRGYIYGLLSNFEQATPLYLSSANQGYAASQNALGEIYEWGLTGTIDHKAAFNWFQKGADGGNRKAQKALATLYYSGSYIEKNYSQAASWFLKSAQQGDKDAQFQIAEMLRNGKGVATDNTQAVNWYRKSALQGHVNAQINLGIMYNEGIGVPQDYAEAFKWFKRAAKSGNSYALYLVGKKYYDGEGVEQDTQKSIKWFERAAERGSKEAEKALSLLK